MIREGSNVSWNWGNGTASGEVAEIYREKVTKQIDNEEISRDGSNDNPAYLIKQDDGQRVLKLKSELNED